MTIRIREIVVSRAENMVGRKGLSLFGHHEAKAAKQRPVLGRELTKTLKS